MATNTIKSFTATGNTAAIDIPQNSVISYAVTSAGSVANVEVQLTTNGTWFVENAGVTVGEVFTTVGPITGIRLAITTLGAGSVTGLEIGGISR